MGLLDILFPKKCVRCKKIGEYICSDCFARISFDTRLICLVCGKGSIEGLTHPACKGKYSIDGAFCGVVYKDIVRKLLYQFKYQPYLTALKPVLTELLYESLIQQQAFMSALVTKPVLVPIPLSAKRLRQRGYNQAELYAKGLGEKFGLEIHHLLVRSKETRPQFGLTREDRQDNMKDAFSVVNSSWFIADGNSSTSSGKNNLFPERNNVESKGLRSEGKTAFLVDDILTTGSTLYEAAKVLKKNGFEKVWGITFAREQ